MSKFRGLTAIMTALLLFAGVPARAGDQETLRQKAEANDADAVRDDALAPGRKPTRPPQALTSGHDVQALTIRQSAPLIARVMHSLRAAAMPATRTLRR